MFLKNMNPEHLLILVFPQSQQPSACHPLITKNNRKSFFIYPYIHKTLKERTQPSSFHNNNKTRDFSGLTFCITVWSQVKVSRILLNLTKKDQNFVVQLRKLWISCSVGRFMFSSRKHNKSLVMTVGSETPAANATVQWIQPGCAPPQPSLALPQKES